MLLSNLGPYFFSTPSAAATRRRKITSAKRNPSENRGQNLKFSRCSVRYQSTYGQIESTQSVRAEPPSLSLKLRSACSRLCVIANGRPFTIISLLSVGSPHAYERNSYG